MSRMDPVKINIPDPAYEAAGIVMATLRKLGMDPFKVVNTVMGRAVVQEWVRGGMSQAQFEKSMRNLAILNSGLRA